MEAILDEINATPELKDATWTRKGPEGMLKWWVYCSRNGGGTVRSIYETWKRAILTGKCKL